MQFIPPLPRTTTTTTPSVPPCPYNFAPPACEIAEPQSPRDLTPRAPGELIPSSATLTDKQTHWLPLANVHFHLGAEHKSEEYDDDVDSKAYDEKSHGGYSVRPGFMCSTASLNSEELKPFKFDFCREGVEVGKTYEVHFVHSSAQYPETDAEGLPIQDLDDGLGTAANGRGILNPQIAVEALVFHIVNGAAAHPKMKNFSADLSIDTTMMYQGSTTGTTYNNTVCSPYVITWHVDTACNRVSPEAFDAMCQRMEEVYGLEKDLEAHSSRKLVLPDYVVKPEFVQPLS